MYPCSESAKLIQLLQIVLILLTDRAERDAPRRRILRQPVDADGKIIIGQFLGELIRPLDKDNAIGILRILIEPDVLQLSGVLQPIEVE